MRLRALLLFTALALPVLARTEGRLKAVSESLSQSQPSSPTAQSKEDPCISACTPQLADFMGKFLAALLDSAFNPEPAVAGAIPPPPAEGHIRPWADVSYYDGLKELSAGARLSKGPLETDFSLTRFEEWPPAGPRDFFWAAKAGAGILVGSGSRLHARFGLGGRVLADPNRELSVGGFNAYAGLAAGLGSFILDSRLDVGSLSNLTVLESKTTLGYVMGSLQVYAGYQSFNISGPGLGGPLIGVMGDF